MSDVPTPGTVYRLREPRGNGYVYDVVEAVGAHAISESEREVVLASVDHFAPSFTVAVDRIYAAGYEQDFEATAALRERREAAAAKVEAERASNAIPLPWEMAS